MWKTCFFPVLVHIFYSNFCVTLSSPWTLCCHSASLCVCNIFSLRSYFAYRITCWPNRLKSRCKYINILAGSMRVGETFIKKHIMLPCTGIHPISRITCCDDIGCQKMKRQVVTSQPFIRRRCEILPCLFSFSRAGFWKVLAGAQSQPQQSCLLHLLSPGLTAAAAAAANAAIAEAMKVKKIKLEAMSSYHSNANHHGGDGENGDLSSSVGESHTHAQTHTDALIKVAFMCEFQ